MAEWDNLLDQWTDGKKTDVELMMKFETDVSDGTLHGGTLQLADFCFFSLITKPCI
jgi:hypothetical protein